MPEKSLPKRAEETIDDLFDLFHRRPVMSTILTLIFVGVMVWFAYEKFFGIPALKAAIETKDQRIEEQIAYIQRLETQLTPFRTLLASKGFTGNEAEGLRQLADEFSRLELRLQNALLAINSFAAEAEVDFTGDWKDGKTPVNGGMLVQSDDPVATIKVELSDGTIKELDLHLTHPLPRVTESAPGKARLKFRMEARTGSWVLDSRLDQLAVLREIKSTTYGIRRSLSTSGEILLEGFKFTLSANGKTMFSIDEESDTKLASGHPEGNALLQWKGTKRNELIDR